MATYPKGTSLPLQAPFGWIGRDTPLGAENLPIKGTKGDCRLRATLAPTPKGRSCDPSKAQDTPLKQRKLQRYHKGATLC